MAAHKLVGVVKHGATQEIEANRVDQHARTVALNNQVIGLGVLIHLKLILKPAAAAG
jgi:hypothetical protein